MTKKGEIADAVGRIYRGIDEQIGAESNPCRACGKCCDFDAYGHRLYVTGPEMIYFIAKVDSEIKAMPAGICPYNIEDKCTVYRHRFAGCRIFCCKGDDSFRSRLTEAAINDFKAICEDFDIPYSYTDLPAALNKK